MVVTIPDPDYLSYMREHHPEKLQVVDESIYFDEFKSLIDKYDLEIMKYERYGIDYDNQYRFYLLNYKKPKFELEQIPALHQTKIKKTFKKIKRRSNIIVRKIKYRKIINSRYA